MKGIRWPIGITVVLALTVAANVGLIYVAGNDPSFALEPDYYAKAITWDSTMAQAQRNQTLGWQLAPTLAGFSRDGARLSVALTDSAGQPISGATIKVSALYNARAAQILESTLRPDSMGYSAQLAVNHRGAWELRFDVRKGDEHFTAIKRVEAEPALAETSGGPGL